VTETSARSAERVAIIGGGVSGAGVAYHLANAGPGIAPEIIVFEPRAELGRGLAYDTHDPAHRINVPAARMSLLPDQPDDFTQWIDETGGIADDPAARRPDGNFFPRRQLFGAYVATRLHPLVASGRVMHCRARVTSVSRQNDGWTITDSHGGKTLADFLVIATSHPAPAAPRSLQAALSGFPRFIADPTVADCLDVIRPDDRVLVVGNGLTAADIIASLTRNGHRGPVTSISRRGLRSRGHAATAQDTYGDFTSAPAASASSLLKAVRATITEAAAAGVSWHAVIDQVRGHGREIWQSLPVAERRRIVRHLRPFWDVHRFRVAPQVEEVLDQAIGEGRLEVLAASVREAVVDGETVEITLRGRNGQSRTKSFDAVVVTTGPAHGGILESQPWLKDLGRHGHLQLDPTGLGIACNERSEAIGAGGEADPSLLISGPLARGTFGELMGLPQVTEHTVLVAEQLVRNLS
jgi:uncharacterized NAD(P)/FAD-binding protein YdhS